jgi:hypothetical protein
MPHTLISPTFSWDCPFKGTESQYFRPSVIFIKQSQCDRGIGFRGFNETAGSVSTVSMRPRDPMWIDADSAVYCNWNSGIGSSGFNDTAESDPAVSMTPRDWILRFQWHCRIGIRGLNETPKTLWNRWESYETAEIFAKTIIDSHSL